MATKTTTTTTGGGGGANFLDVVRRRQQKMSPQYAPTLLRQADAGRAVLRDGAPGLTLGVPPPLPIGVDEKTASAMAIITSIDRDRLGDEVVPEGCDLSAYRRTPVVFFGHQAIPFPVGVAENPQTRTLDVEIEPGRLIRSRCYFHQATREAMQVFDLVRLGVLRGVSIGFNPLSEPVPLPPQQYKGPVPPPGGGHQQGSNAGRHFHGFRYDRWELLEWSFVGIQANSVCTVVRECLSRGRLAGDPIVPAIRKALEPLSEKSPAWSNGAAPLSPDAKPNTKSINNNKGSRKAMNESTGAAGGFAVVPPTTAATTIDEATKAIREAICNCAKSHCDSSDFLYHPDERHCWQKHSDTLSDGVLKLCREALTEVDGIDTVTQSKSHPPRGLGWKMFHPKDMDWLEEKEGEGEGETEEESASAEKKEQPASQTVVDEEEDELSVRKEEGDGDDNKDDMDSSVKALSRLPEKSLERMLKSLAPRARKRADVVLPGLAAIDMPRRLALAVAVAKAMNPITGEEEEDEEEEEEGEGKKPAPSSPDAAAAESKGEGGGEDDDDMLAGLLDDDEEEGGGAAPAAAVDEKADSPDLPAMIAELVAATAQIQEAFLDAGKQGKAAPPPPAPAAAAAPEEEEEEDDDGGSIDDILAKYRNPKSFTAGKNKALPSSAVVSKRLNKGHWKTIREAADHYGELSELEPGACKWTVSHQLSCRAHGLALGEMYKSYHRDSDGESPMEVESEEEAAPPSSPDEDGGGAGADLQKDGLGQKKQMESIVGDSIKEAFGEINETIYRITGRRA